ncbi:hypothetical protein BDV96DRAFT_591058 [Lophiotrema nucula]|uniref:Uncharacterized protein n=1 Tax=Lophiotrema nucula TaxID=690887 RepID=A0A6A5YHB3_9PLEO|nr:hypothetical protein BDV96DRAFT_591058 [Lophiotrema nucula]
MGSFVAPAGRSLADLSMASGRTVTNPTKATLHESPAHRIDQGVKTLHYTTRCLALLIIWTT